MPIPNFQGTHLLSPAKFFFFFLVGIALRLGHFLGIGLSSQHQDVDSSNPAPNFNTWKSTREWDPIGNTCLPNHEPLGPPHPKMGADFCAQTQLLRLKILVLQSSPHHTSPTAPASLTDASAANLSPLWQSTHTACLAVPLLLV